MDDIFQKAMESSLIWIPSLGMGYCKPAKPFNYRYEYYQEYVDRGKTEIGKAINKFRVEFVNKHTTEELLDFGAGAGDFVKTRGFNTFGWDIGEGSLDNLIRSGLSADPEPGRWDMSFWDSLEHVENPSEVISGVKEWAFVSMPVYNNGLVESSKHYKPGEHLWYWTEWGFINWMKENGFQRVEVSDQESRLGRQSILTFAFRRTSSMSKLNIGCGNDIRPEPWINIDVESKDPRVIVRDILRGLPFDDNSFDEVYCSNILEHILPGKDSIFIMNEIYRVCKPKAVVEVIVPHANSQGAHQDPTHVNYFVPRCGLYWNLSWTPWPRMYGSTADFDVISSYPSDSINYPAFKIEGSMATEAFIHFKLIAKPKEIIL